MPDNLTLLREKVYQQRLHVGKLRREAFDQSDPQAAVFIDLTAAEISLAQMEAQLAAAEPPDPQRGLVAQLNTVSGGAGTLLGAETTGLLAQVHLRMEQVPTAIYHLLDPSTDPLLTCTVTNYSSNIRRLRVTSFIEGYSAKAIHTAEIDPDSSKPYDFKQSPTLFPDSLHSLNELTRATLNVMVEDLDNGKVELHTTYPIWLLARTTAPLSVRDLKTGAWKDLTPYLGAFVTPNVPSLMGFLRVAASLAPQKRLVGYQGDKNVVEPQAKALFDALKSAEITYVNSIISFSLDQGLSTQRVRLPRESIDQKEANCIDGTVLFASLLEGISLNPALVIVPGHAFVAWSTWADATGVWQFLETTMVGTDTFEEARTMGDANAARYKALAEVTNNPAAFTLWPLRTLRTERKITPME